jgi:O-succinylbenzoic acid--CoA ligase
LESAADRHPHDPALILAEGPVAYAELAAQVHSRMRSLQAVVTDGVVVPVPVRLDLASIVEMLAVMKAGGVVAPYATHRPVIVGRPPRGTAVCIQTSGSAGEPKTVPLSYDNIAASVGASRSRLGNGPQDRWLATLPLTHVGGLSVLWRSLEIGGAVVVAPFDASLPGLLEATRPSFASLVPTMVHRLLENAPDALAAIGTVLIGGDRLSEALRDKASLAGVSLVPTYGMTETTSQVATARTRDVPSDPAVVGPPLDGFTVTIQDDGSLPSGEHGVIVVDGPAVFAGYLGEAPRRGPFETADVGYLTSDGRLAVLGRRDEVVITGGENVDLADVRNVITAVPHVRDAVVVGVPDPEWGVVICALVECHGSLDERSLRAIVEEQLRPHERPRYWDFGDVPVLPNGKHDAAAVRTRFTDE